MMSRSNPRSRMVMDLWDAIEELRNQVSNFPTQNPTIPPQTAATSTITVVPSTIVVGTVILAANSARVRATIFNDSTKKLSLAYGPAGGPLSRTTELDAGMEHDVLDGYTGLITGAWNAANGSARVTELTP